MANEKDLIEKAVEVATSAEADAPLRIDCDVPGHEGEWVEYKRRGWRFKHLRLYEATVGMDNVTMMVAERIIDWHLTTDGEPVPFLPKKAAAALAAARRKKAPDAALIERLEGELEDARRTALDELDPAVATFVIGSFREAYFLVGLPSPN